jgi:hypothetical protein
MIALGSASPVELWDNGRALPKTPQAHQQEEEIGSWFEEDVGPRL